MSVEYMQAIKRRYERLGYAPYRWYIADDEPPWQAPPKPLAASRVGLLSTAGVYALGQVAYHYRDDTSIRALPADLAPERTRFSHITENYLTDARRDPDCMVPLRALHTLAHDGVIGSVARRVYSCMGGVYSQRRVREETAPALLTALREEGVDCALLVAM